MDAREAKDAKETNSLKAETPLKDEKSLKNEKPLKAENSLKDENSLRAENSLKAENYLKAENPLRDAKSLKAAVEALLFASGDPVSASSLAQALCTERKAVEGFLIELSREYEDRGSGLKILRLSDKYQMCARSDFSDQINELLRLRRNAPLSQAAFEVLAVIAYNQPVTKSFIEQVRGVDCSGVVASLLQKGLIEERGRLELPGRPLIYGTTAVFLRCFSLESLDELPPLPQTKDEEEAEEASENSGGADFKEGTEAVSETYAAAGSGKAAAAGSGTGTGTDTGIEPGTDTQTEQKTEGTQLSF